MKILLDRTVAEWRASWWWTCCKQWHSHNNKYTTEKEAQARWEPEMQHEKNQIKWKMKEKKIEECKSERKSHNHKPFVTGRERENNKRHCVVQSKPRTVRKKLLSDCICYSHSFFTLAVKMWQLQSCCSVSPQCCVVLTFLLFSLLSLTTKKNNTYFFVVTFKM